MMARLTFAFLAILLGVDVIAAQRIWPFFYPDTYVEDMGAFVWNNRDSWIPDNYAPCVIRQSGGVDDLEGTCSHSVDCRLSGGRSFSRGNCSVLHSCCIYEKTCDQTVKARVAYFKEPRIPRRDNNRPCSLKVDTVNDNVCQMRVDIESMTLTDPTINGAGTTNSPYTVTCDNDMFTTSSFSSASRVKLPALCGQNTDTHFYIHLDEGQKQVSLDFFLGGITSNTPVLVGVNWKLKVTQLECPSREKIFDLAKKRENRNQANYDYERLAPEGCLQYYPEPSGTVKSFGYVGRTAASPSTLTTSQNYAICFRNFANCGTMFSSVAQATNLRPASAAPPPVCSNGYIYVSGFPEIDTMDNARKCPPLGTATATTTPYQAIHTGPAFIQVFIPNTLTVGTPAVTVNGGFSWDYSTITNCNSS